MSSARSRSPPYVAASREPYSSRPPHLLVLTGPVRRRDVPELCARLRAAQRASPDAEVICDVGAVTTADLPTLDALARLQLTARRGGGGIRLRNPPPGLWALLELAGFDQLLAPDGASLRVEVERHPEEREPPLGVQEAVESGDAPP